MSKRRNRLIREMNLKPENQKLQVITKTDIKSRVNHTLNLDFEERNHFIRQKTLKTAILIAVVMAFTTTAFAAANSELLRTFFSGDTSSLEASVKAPLKSVNDGRFTLTLEQVIASRYQVLVIYSIEGMTESAIRELMRDDFVDMDTMSFGPINRNSTEKFDSFCSKELMDKRTSAKRYWAIESTAILNTSESDFYISLNKMQKPEKLIIPMKCNVETKELVFEGQPYGEATIKFSPLGVIYEKGIARDLKKVPCYTDVYFRMKNGTIKTYNELLDFRSCELVKDEDGDPYRRYEYSALFREIQNLSDFKSVIVGNIEYDIHDTSKTKALKIDKSLKPFELKPLYKDILWVPLKEFSKKIGADYQWDERSKTATIQYRDSKYVITVGNTSVIKDGKEVKLGEEEPFFLKGQLVVPASVITDAFHMTINLENLQDRQGNTTDIKDWVWTVVP